MLILTFFQQEHCRFVVDLERRSAVWFKSDVGLRSL